MLFIVGLPVVQILLFCYAIGHDPTGLKVAVANHEMSEEMIMQQFCPVHAGCNQTMLSCRYLDMLVKNKSMVVVSMQCKLPLGGRMARANSEGGGAQSLASLRREPKCYNNHS